MSSTPVTVIEGPIHTNTLAHKRYLVLYVIMIVLAFLPPAYLLLRFPIFRMAHGPWWQQLVFPVALVGVWLLGTLSAVLVSAIFLQLVKLKHKPREGVFQKDPADKDYRAWSLRGVTRKLGLWAANLVPIPLFKRLAYRLLGSSTKTGGAYFDYWVDPEFVEIGEDSVIGHGSVVTSAMVLADKLIIRRVRLGRNVHVANHSVIAPGVDVGDDTVIGPVSTTEPGKTYEGGQVYNGVPLQAFRPNQYTKERVADADAIIAEFESSRQALPTDEDQREVVQPQTQKLSYPWYLGAFFVIFYVAYIIPAVLAYLYYQLVVYPVVVAPGVSLARLATELPALLAFLSLPLFLFALYCLHMVLYVLVLGAFVKLTERISPSQKGVFKRDFEESYEVLKYYQVRGFLSRLLKWKIMRSLLPWLMNWAISRCHFGTVGKGVTQEDHYVGSEFLQIGAGTYIGYGALVGTHTVEGAFGRIVISGSKFGENCTVCSGVLIGPDANFLDNSHALPGSGLPKGYKLRSNKFYLGRPPIRLPRSKARKYFAEPPKKTAKASTGPEQTPKHEGGASQ